jgi:hypothetical protein
MRERERERESAWKWGSILSPLYRNVFIALSINVLIDFASAFIAFHQLSLSLTIFLSLFIFFLFVLSRSQEVSQVLPHLFLIKLFTARFPILKDLISLFF